MEDETDKHMNLPVKVMAGGLDWCLSISFHIVNYQYIRISILSVIEASITESLNIGWPPYSYRMWHTGRSHGD